MREEPEAVRALGGGGMVWEAVEREQVGVGRVKEGGRRAQVAADTGLAVEARVRAAGATVAVQTAAVEMVANLDKAVVMMGSVTEAKA